MREEKIFKKKNGERMKVHALFKEQNMSVWLGHKVKKLKGLVGVRL